VTTSTIAAFTVLIAQFVCHAQTITRVAGGGDSNVLGDGGLATNGSLAEPTSVAFDAAGNLYIADYMNNRIRKVDTNGVITTVAGNGTPDSTGDGGLATKAAIHLPWGVAVDGAGNIYFSERINSRVRRVNPLGIINTIAGTGSSGYFGDGGLARQAQLYNPTGLAVDGAGNLYIADTVNGRIRIVKTDGTIQTVAGKGAASALGDGGLATNASLSSPQGVMVDSSGTIYIAEGNRIRKVTNSTGIITTVAGGSGASATGDGGPAINASLQTPGGVIVDGAGNIYIGDTANNRVRRVDGTTGVITTITGGHIGAIGDGGLAINANVGMPIGLALDCSGNLYIADNAHNLVRKVSSVASSASPGICAVLNGASLQSGISPNSWATIKGVGLAPITDNWDKVVVNGQLPTALDGVSVTIGGKPAYVYYVSANQINFVVPDVGVGPQQLIVTNGGVASPPYTVTVSKYSPAFFLWPGGQPVATRQDYSWAVKNGTFSGTSTIPAKPGDVIILWGTGFGPTIPTAPQGVQIPGDQTYSTSSPVTVTIDNLSTTVYGGALTSGSAALFQIAIQVPMSLADGDWPIQTSIGGVQTSSGGVLSVHH